eukprot:m.13511 g.13511  ORF g.13511 m.13511 type:complete len:303 (+) comp4674_c0_seq1:798-1706(+)
MARHVVPFGVEEVYNLPVTEGFLLLDVRPEEAYLRSHVVGAWHCHIDSTATLSSVFEQVSAEDPPEMLNTVVVCCLPGQDVSSVTDLLEALTPESLDNPSPHSFGPRLARLLTSIAVFSDTEPFGEHYPFFVASGKSRYSDDGARLPMLPALIHPADPISGRGALYLGAELHASSQEAFALLGIAAVVNATVEVQCHFEDEGSVVYHRCAIQDDLTQRLSDAFVSTHQFLEKHGPGAGVNTLVHCSRGRNRSAAMVAHHLMQTTGVSADEAVAIVRQRRPGGTLSNTSFVEQLQRLGALRES